MKFLKNVDDSDKFMGLFYGLVLICVLTIIALTLGDYMKHKERMQTSKETLYCTAESK